MGATHERPAPAAASDESWKDDPWLGVFPPELARQSDPYKLLARLRDHDPVNETPIGLFRLTRYDDVVRMLKEVPSGVRFSDGTAFGMAATAGGVNQFILQRDPPDHTRLRKLMSQAFKPRAMDRLRARVQELADELLDEVIERGELDVIRDLALPVPSTVICEMMGVPLADRARFTEWTSLATHLLAAALLPPDAIARSAAAADELAAYFQELIADRRQHLGEDILSELIRAEEAGDRLSQTELLSQSIGLLIAGFETTIGLIGNGVRALVTHPDQLELLQESPHLIGSAVEECLRYDGPILLTIRITREDTQFGGKTIPRDRPVMCMLAAANHDPAHFADPERFDIRRTDNDHLAFGGGAHFCLGVHLARMETQIAIATLVRRVRDLELASEEVEWGRSLFRVLGRLPLAFRPRH
ncbi:MAG TPA: cytochrome P450 [Candidatus Limnocylindrales bacterium]|nr:cytochrome P450 [Candidatus Limnocylindrales bacterium]